MPGRELVKAVPDGHTWLPSEGHIIVRGLVMEKSIYISVKIMKGACRAQISIEKSGACCESEQGARKQRCAC